MKPTSTESWCVIWYLGAFGSLVCFFLIITCVELFFKNPLYPNSEFGSYIPNIHQAYVPETPPPSYHLFAPPDYNETIKKIVNEKRPKLDIFVVPVHIKTMFAPPNYDDVVRKVNDKKVDTVVIQGKLNPIE